MADVRHGLHWPKAGTAVEPPPRERRRPSLLLAAIVACVVALLLVSTLSVIYAVRVEQRLITLEEYVQGRGEYRDREAARMEAENTERTRRAACDLLDTFPEGLPALERARNKYDCGPGIPLSLLAPEERARLEPEPPVSPSGEALPPTSSQGAQPTPPGPKAEPSTPAPASTPEPLPDVGVTVPVCEALNVCID